MNYRLICVDIDGTLIDDQKKIPTLVKESLQKAFDRGLQIALVTGRAPAGADLIEQELGFPCIKACNAGTYIVMEDQCIHNKILPPEMAEKIEQDFAIPYKMPLWIFQGRNWCVTKSDNFVEKEIALIQCKPTFVEVKSVVPYWKRMQTGPNKLLLAADPLKILQIQKELKQLNLPELDVARSSASYLELFPKGVTKGQAIAAICEKLNISLKETIAFGDQELDIPMIKAAGTGIAMGNGTEELKQAADFVTKTNNEAGIAFALKRYLGV